MPATVIAAPPLAMAMAAYRVALARKLATAGGAAWTGVSEPALAAFPRILADPQLTQQFLALWIRRVDWLLTAAQVRQEHPA